MKNFFRKLIACILCKRNQSESHEDPERIDSRESSRIRNIQDEKGVKENPFDGFVGEAARFSEATRQLNEREKENEQVSQQALHFLAVVGERKTGIPFIKGVELFETHLDSCSKQGFVSRDHGKVGQRL